MTDLYSQLDNSSLLMFLFYPQKRHGRPPHGTFDLQVPVADGITITCRAYPGEEGKPWLLYFHGNGEVVSDYDGIAPMYNEKGLNLLVADYRGYGASTGSPTFKDMVSDARVIFDYVTAEESEIGAEQDWYVMGRSLGSISTLELAANRADQIKGLIIESGFISVAGLIHHLGLPSPGGLSSLEDEYRRLTANIRLPALIIHGEHDRLVPLTQGKDLHESLGSDQK
ncbi:MAG: alpha/beta hydrolase, partial [Bacillota bacterium]